MAATTASELFEQAIGKFEEAVKTGLKLQEEASSAWTEILAGAGTPTEWQARFEEVAKKSIPKAQENIDTALKTMESNYATSLDLLKKAMEAAQSTTVEEGQERTTALWERSMEAMRENAQTVMQANAKIAEAWTDMMTQNGEAKKTAKS